MASPTTQVQDQRAAADSQLTYDRSYINRLVQKPAKSRYIVGSLTHDPNLSWFELEPGRKLSLPLGLFLW